MRVVFKLILNFDRNALLCAETTTLTNLTLLYHRINFVKNKQNNRGSFKVYTLFIREEHKINVFPCSAVYNKIKLSACTVYNVDIL